VTERRVGWDGERQRPCCVTIHGRDGRSQRGQRALSVTGRVRRGGGISCTGPCTPAVSVSGRRGAVAAGCETWKDSNPAEKPCGRSGSAPHPQERREERRAACPCVPRFLKPYDPHTHGVKQPLHTGRDTRHDRGGAGERDARGPARTARPRPARGSERGSGGVPRCPADRWRAAHGTRRADRDRAHRTPPPPQSAPRTFEAQVNAC
jgi:hypothetical protein